MPNKKGAAQRHLFLLGNVYTNWNLSVRLLSPCGRCNAYALRGSGLPHQCAHWFAMTYLLLQEAPNLVRKANKTTVIARSAATWQSVSPASKGCHCPKGNPISNTPINRNLKNVVCYRVILNGVPFAAWVCNELSAAPGRQIGIGLPVLFQGAASCSALYFYGLIVTVWFT